MFLKISAAAVILTSTVFADYTEKIPLPNRLDPEGNDLTFFPLAIDSKSRILGGFNWTPFSSEGIAYWSFEKGFEEIPNPPGAGDSFFRVFSSPAADSVVAEVEVPESVEFRVRPHRWTQSRGWIELKAESPGGEAGVYATANEGVRSAGRVLHSGGTSQPAIWDADGVLETFALPDGFNSGEIQVLSGDGSRAFGAFYAAQQGGRTLWFTWDVTTGLENLGIPAGWDIIFFNAVSGNGSLGIGSVRLGNQDRFFTWSISEGFKLIQGSTTSLLYKAWMSADGSLAILETSENEQMVWRKDEDLVSFREFVVDENDLSPLLFGSSQNPILIHELALNENGTAIAGSGRIITAGVGRDEGFAIRLGGSEPPLEISREGARMKVSWPLVYDMDLIRSGDLSFGGAPRVTGSSVGKNVFTEPVGSQKFFRLAPSR